MTAGIFSWKCSAPIQGENTVIGESNCVVTVFVYCPLLIHGTWKKYMKKYSAAKKHLTER